jgi:HAD domain in Swiss Army Knife RNA repair proteins
LKSPRGQGSTVLYLDFDGVLHHENVWWHRRRGAYVNMPGCRLFEHSHLLERTLSSFPEVRIVLSTSWVRVRSYSLAVKRLSPGLQQRLIGATFHSRMNRNDFEALPRGTQILNDVSRRRPLHWLALDDDAEGWASEYRHCLIHCDGALGISAPGVLDELHAHLSLICSSH